AARRRVGRRDAGRGDAPAPRLLRLPGALPARQRPLREAVLARPDRRVVLHAGRVRGLLRVRREFPRPRDPFRGAGLAAGRAGGPDDEQPRRRRPDGPGARLAAALLAARPAVVPGGPRPPLGGGGERPAGRPSRAGARLTPPPRADGAPRVVR